MKKVLLLFLVLVLSCSTNKKENDLEKKNLKGNVKYVREILFTTIDKFGEISKGDIESDNNSYTLYNNKGNKIELNVYNSDGSLDYKYTYKYDDKGNKIEWNVYNSDGSLNYKETSKYVYDSNNNWIKKFEFQNEIPIYITEREIVYYD